MSKRITLPFFSLWLTGKAYKDSGLSIKGGLMPIIKDGELDYVFESGWATYVISLVAPTVGHWVTSIVGSNLRPFQRISHSILSSWRMTRYSSICG